MSDRSSHKSAPSEPADSTPRPAPPSSADGSDSHARVSAGGSSQAQLTVISARQPTGGMNLERAAPPLESINLLEGERLGQFLLQQFIGGGGMGVVFRALDTTLNREVAVKVLSRDQSADEEALRRFRNEAQSAARLNHENIARVHYVGDDRGVHYIVFEFIEGINLRDRVEQNGPLPLSEAVSYTYQIAQALDHACQRDVIHRDIKPSNVLITPDGKAKLVDMGLARLNQVAQADNDLTASGVTLGTFDYISPEQARDPRSADVRSDMYSLGCSFFYMLTGRPPFPEGTVLQKLLQHQADSPPDPRSVRPELPSEVTWLLARMLAKNPSQRFQLPSELADELIKMSAKLGLHLNVAPTSWSRPQSNSAMARWRQHLPWAVPLALLFVIVLVLDAVWSTNAPRPDVSQRVSSPDGASPAVSTAPKNTPPSASSPGRTTESAAPSPPVAAPDITSRPNDVPQVEIAPFVPPPVASASPADQELAPVTVDDLARLASTLSGGIGVESVAGELSTTLGGSAGTSVRPGATDVRPPDATDHEPRSDDAAASGAAAARAAQVAPRSVPDGLLVVSSTEQGGHVYTSLRAACDNAVDGGVIELRFTGRLVEEPITISNRTLTIRAGDGHRPVIVFRPDANPVKYPPSMFTVAGGTLHVGNVHWELDVPRHVPRDWALFETRRADVLRFERSSFTIRNASPGRKAFLTGVAFLDVKGAPGGTGMGMDPANGQSAVMIDLEHCVARGEATFLRGSEMEPLRLHWNNGLLAVSERMLVLAGGTSKPQAINDVQINLHHVTAMLQGGLALLTNSEDAPFQLETEIVCNDSILATLANAPLIEQRGSSTVDDYKARIEWSGAHNFFDGFETFWRIGAGASQTSGAELNFDAWQAFWGGNARADSRAPIRWKQLPANELPFSSHSPQDYALDNSFDDNPPVDGASNGLDAGCMAWQLSTLPPPPVAVEVPHGEASAGALGRP